LSIPEAADLPPRRDFLNMARNGSTYCCAGASRNGCAGPTKMTSELQEQHQGMLRQALGLRMGITLEPRERQPRSPSGTKKRR